MKKKRMLFRVNQKAQVRKSGVKTGIFTSGAISDREAWLVYDG